MSTDKKSDITGQNILAALIAWLKIFIYFLILPFKIWKGAMLRLAKRNNEEIISGKEEFPMYTMAQISIDATIFILGLLAVPSALVGVGFAIYFFVIPIMSFVKEMLTISLSMVQKLNSIDNNTQNK